MKYLTFTVEIFCILNIMIYVNENTFLCSSVYLSICYHIALKQTCIKVSQFLKLIECIVNI